MKYVIIIVKHKVTNYSLIRKSVIQIDNQIKNNIQFFYRKVKLHL